MEFVEIFTDAYSSCDKCPFSMAGNETWRLSKYLPMLLPTSLLMAGNATAAAMEINKKREAELFKLKQVPFALHCTCIFPKLVASGVES